MHALLWLLQIGLGLYFVVFGVAHFVVPEGLPEQASWFYDLDDTVHAVAGTAEILGGLGLVLPALTGIQRRLVVWAAVGLMLLMAVAAVWHATRGEIPQLGLNLVTAAVLGFVAYGRARLHPHPARRSDQPS